MVGGEVNTSNSAKPVYKSRTIITNIIAAVVVALAKEFGVELSQEEVAAVFAAINIMLRAITSKPLKISLR